MDLGITIVAGLTLMTLIAAGFDYLGKRSKKLSADSGGRLKDLESRLKAVEFSLAERDERIARLEGDLQFMGRLIEDKSGGTTSGGTKIGG